ncbi:MAG TPA: nitrilase-related carbon-nitrogen hydrolase [Mycobacteriales bacterium]|nr:nitrilase-related carbon-nitrogen hydrolase [Mycobacteriales bacterium]
MRVTLLQLEVDRTVPYRERVASVCAAVAGCAASDLVLLPELWATTYFAFDDYAATAEPLDGPTVAALGAAAAAAGVHLHGGSIVERDGDRLCNTSLLFGPDGALLGTYRKFHLFGYGSRETALLTPGTAVGAVPTALGTVALSTCYDLRFPELYRLQVAAGAELFLVGAAWPAARLAHWQLLLRARAVENQAFLAACGAAGRQGDVELSGRSAVVDPWGQVLVEGGGTAETLTVELDLGEVARARKEFPALADRRIPVPPLA